MLVSDERWSPGHTISRPFPLLLPLGQGNPWIHWTMDESARSPVLPVPHSSTTISLLCIPSLPASLSSSQRQQIPLFSFSIFAHSLYTSQLAFLSHVFLSSDSFRSISLLLHRVTSSMLFQPKLYVSAPPARSLLSRLRDGAEKW